MKLLVVFGSKTDSYIYEPLKSRLISDGHDIEFMLRSFHRSPEALRKEIESLNVDAVVAGAGLAANLPGYLASRVPFPVFGVPCTPAMEGLDALLSMIQMPFGVPTIVSAPDDYLAITNFIQKWAEINPMYQATPFSLVVERSSRDQAHIQYFLKIFSSLVEKAEVNFPISEKLSSDGINVCLVELDGNVSRSNHPFYQNKNPDSLILNVPTLKPDNYKNHNAALALIDRMKLLGGLWLGLNMIGNGVLAALLLANKNGKFNPILTNCKKGYIHA